MADKNPPPPPLSPLAERLAEQRAELRPEPLRAADLAQLPRPELAPPSRASFIPDLNPGDADDWSIYQHNFTAWLMRNPEVLATGKVPRADPPPEPPAIQWAD